MILKCSIIILKYCVFDFESLLNDFKMNLNDFSRCSKNFEREDLQISSNICLRSRIFPFNPFWLAGANQKITFWGPWTYFKLIVIFDFDLNIFIFVSFIP